MASYRYFDISRHDLVILLWEAEVTTGVEKAVYKQFFHIPQQFCSCGTDAVFLLRFWWGGVVWLWFCFFFFNDSICYHFQPWLWGRRFCDWIQPPVADLSHERMFCSSNETKLVYGSGILWASWYWSCIGISSDMVEEYWLHDYPSFDLFSSFTQANVV